MPDVAFLIDSGELSGGTNVIFRHALHAIEQGWRVTFVSPRRIERSEVQWHAIGKHYDHPNLQWLDFIGVIERHFDIAIATWWRTCYSLWKVSAERYVYFVQSIESRFYKRSEEATRYAVDATYDLPLGHVTEATWIRDYLERLHGRRAVLARNGIDKNIYVNDGPALAPRQPGKLRVLVEGAVDADFKNVPLSLRLARQAEVDELWLLTTSRVDRTLDVDRVISRVPPEETPAIYRSCDVLLKLSLVEGMFGPPLEMFHCGGSCVVYDVTGHDEYIRDGHNGFVVRTGDEAAIVERLRLMREDPLLLDTLKRNAIETAVAWPGWPDSSARFLEAVQLAAENGAADRATLGRQTRRVWSFLEAAARERGDIRAELQTPHLEMPGFHVHSAGTLDFNDPDRQSCDVVLDKPVDLSGEGVRLVVASERAMSALRVLVGSGLDDPWSDCAERWLSLREGFNRLDVGREAFTTLRGRVDWKSIRGLSIGSSGAGTQDGRATVWCGLPDNLLLDLSGKEEVRLNAPGFDLLSAGRFVFDDEGWRSVEIRFDTPVDLRYGVHRLIVTLEGKVAPALRIAAGSGLDDPFSDSVQRPLKLREGLTGIELTPRDYQVLRGAPDWSRIRQVSIGGFGTGAVGARVTVWWSLPSGRWPDLRGQGGSGLHPSSEINQANAELARVRAELADARSELAQTNSALTDARRRIDLMTRTTSWRITLPLRRADKVIQRVKRALGERG